MNDSSFGLIAATHTPFDSQGELNLTPLPKLAEHLVRNGVRGIFIGGTTGESHSLTLEERQTLTSRWAELTRGSPLKVIVQVGHNCQRDAITLARQANQVGAMGISALAPSFFRPANVSDLLTYLEPIAAAAAPLPFFYYDIPGMTHVSLPCPEIMSRGAERMANFRGIKYSNPDSVQLQECLKQSSATMQVFYGIDENFLSGLALGVQGVVGSTYNFAAPLYHRLLEAFRRGDWTQAREEQSKAISLVRILSRFGFLAASKYVMFRLGIDLGTVRPPLRPLTRYEERELDQLLDTADFFHTVRIA